jgi:hypothetical protein
MQQSNVKLDRQFFTGIFLIGTISLMTELIQVKMLSFFLGVISNFLAIPIALFGLALGSLFCHFLYKGDKRRLISVASTLVFPVLIAVFVAFFFIANTFFNRIHAGYQNPVQDVGRLFVYSSLFLVPYCLYGAMLSSYFSIGSKRIGKLYFYDLVGAALGCFITPMLFTYTDLPVVITVLIFTAFLLLINDSVSRFRIPLIAVAAVGFGIVLAGSFSGRLFKEHPKAGVLGHILMRGLAKTGVEEVDFVWNDLARTSLLMSGVHRPFGYHEFGIVQDDGISNVVVKAYNPQETAEQVKAYTPHHTFPFVIGMNPKRILVIFAGVGRDMVLLDRLSNGKADITGVEINGAVVEFINNPIMIGQNLRAFTRKKNIHLTVREGRDFLNNDPHKYDYIYVATNGAAFAVRTGHTRKYLDTYEAMVSYMDHLEKGGMITFANQPNQQKLPIFRKIFKDRDMGEVRKAVFMFGFDKLPFLDSLVVKPDGFTPQQIAQMEQQMVRVNLNFRQTLVSPFHPPVKRLERQLHIPEQRYMQDMVTDDRPFLWPVKYAGFELFPSKEQMGNKEYATNWIKILTLILFTLISVLVMVAVRFLGGPGGRLPFVWLLYFLISGIGYMGVEVGLMAKTELLLGSPLYAVAVILAFFLTSNGIGAYLQDRYQPMKGFKSLLIYTSATVLWGILAVEICNTYLLSVPLALKIFAVAVCVMPVGTCLGMYYPFGVAKLAGSKYQNAIPATYAIATLSSVLGSAAAMTFITNLGFSRIILLGGLFYAAVAVIYVIATRVFKTV